MTSNRNQQVSFSAPMHPAMDDNGAPVPPIRHEFERNPQEERLLPQPPPRMDRPDPDDTNITPQVTDSIMCSMLTTMSKYLIDYTISILSS